MAGQHPREPARRGAGRPRAGRRSTCDDWGPVVAELYADLGIAYDGERGQRIAAAAAPLAPVRQDAAILLHDRGRRADEARDHLARWALQSPERADKTIAFLTDPLWRAYIADLRRGRAAAVAVARRPPGAAAGGRALRAAARRAADPGRAAREELAA